MRFFITGIVLFSIFSSVAYAHDVGNVLRIDQPVPSDKYIAGRIIQVTASIQGDLTAAGQRLIIEGEVQGDLNSAGESVEIRSTISDDVRAAGRYIRINSAVKGHIVAAGDTILLGPDASVGEWTWLAGRSVEVEGQIGSELKIAGRSILIKAEVIGDAILAGKDIQLGSGTIIHGDLIIQGSEEPTIAADVEIMGEVILKGVPEITNEQGRFVKVSTFGATLLLIVSIIIPVLAFILLFPQASDIAAREVRKNPFGTLGLGFSIAIISPVLIIILFITGVGFVLGLLALGAYVFALLLGLLLGIVICNQYVLDKFSNKKNLRILSSAFIVILTSTLILVLAWLPLVGQILLLVIWTAGLGIAGKGARCLSLEVPQSTK